MFLHSSLINCFTCISTQIKTEDVSSFWNLPSCKDLVEVCQTKLYPPRFTIEVSAKRATKDTFVEVWFDGAVDEHRTEIQLECPTECEFIVDITMQKLRMT